MASELPLVKSVKKSLLGLVGDMNWFAGVSFSRLAFSPWMSNARAGAAAKLAALQTARTKVRNLMASPESCSSDSRIRP
jgi:hypothetical protein